MLSEECPLYTEFNPVKVASSLIGRLLPFPFMLSECPSPSPVLGPICLSLPHRFYY